MSLWGFQEARPTLKFSSRALMSLMRCCTRARSGGAMLAASTSCPLASRCLSGSSMLVARGSTWRASAAASCSLRLLHKIYHRGLAASHKS